MTVAIQHYQNPLTLDKWIYFASGDRDNKIDRETLVERFSELEKYPQIIDNFFSIPWAVREQFPNIDLSVPSVIAFANLFYHHSMLYTEYSNWHEIGTTETRVAFPHFHKKFSNDLHRISEYFAMSIWEHKNHGWRTASDYVGPTCLMLATIYGEDRVIEVIKYFSNGVFDNALDPWNWVDLSNAELSKVEHKKLHTFVSVVDQWEELQNFPIDWAIKVTDSSLCNRLSDLIMHGGHPSRLTSKINTC